MKATIQTDGSICLFTPLDCSAQDWFDENVEVPDHMRLGKDSIACEARYAGTLAEGFIADGGEVVS